MYIGLFLSTNTLYRPDLVVPLVRKHTHRALFTCIQVFFVLQCVAVCCSALQCVAVCVALCFFRRVYRSFFRYIDLSSSMYIGLFICIHWSLFYTHISLFSSTNMLNNPDLVVSLLRKHTCMTLFINTYMSFFP